MLTLHIHVESVYKKASGGTKRVALKSTLDGPWGDNHDRSLELFKNQLAAGTKLPYRKDGYDICLFKRASDKHWAAILSKVPENQRRRKLEYQEHRPLSFLSSAFTGASGNWSVPGQVRSNFHGKEGFAIVESMCRLDYIICSRTVSIFTDHANLVYIFDPYGRNTGIARHTASNLMRCALKMRAFRYIIEHVAGECNVWADILTS